MSKDVRKTIVPSFIFLFNSFEVCRFSPLNQWNQKKHTWFSRKIFTFYRKWKIKNAVVLDVRSAAHLEPFLIKQGVLFLHVSNVSGVYRGVRLRSHVWYAEACNVMNKLEIETKSLFFFSNMMKANLHKCYLNCPLVWMFYSRAVNSKLNRIHEKCLNK